ncbi:uncharacterized protein GJ701_001707 isoform 2-T2 [Geothlypis trichas]
MCKVKFGGEKTQDSTNGHFCQQETTWGIRGEEDWKRRRVPGKQKHGSRNSHQSGVTFSSILLPVLLLLLLSPGSCRGMVSRPGPAGEAAGRAPAAPRRPEEEEAAPGPQEVRLPRARRPRPRPGSRCAVTGGGGQRRPRPRGQRPAGPFLTRSAAALLAQRRTCPARPYLVEVGVAEHVVAPLHGAGAEIPLQPVVQIMVRQLPLSGGPRWRKYQHWKQKRADSVELSAVFPILSERKSFKEAFEGALWSKREAPFEVKWREPTAEAGEP